MSEKTLILNNGYSMPKLGLGTWLSKPGEVGDAVKCAIDVGYRHIDCAYAYENENEVGNAIAEKIREGVVKREELFVTTKLWCTFQRKEYVERAMNLSLAKLNLDYIDLYLIHFPVGFKFIDENELLPKNDNGDVINDDVDYMETWKAMEALLAHKKVRSIGVSNFNQYQIERIMREGSVVPAANQIELHPFFPQEKLMTFCKQNNIAVVAFSPFGAPGRDWASEEEPKPLNDATIAKIAERFQILF